MALRALLFDLDGTLLDTSGDLGGALNALLIDKHREPLPLERIRPQVSNGANALVKLGFGESLSESEFLALRQALLDHYFAQIAQHTQPFEGIYPLIAELSVHNLQWGIATNKPWRYTEKLLPHFDFPSPPGVTLCPDHVKQSKPDPEMLTLACERLGVRAQEAIYIGDHSRDIECGRRAGMKTLAVGYGFTSTPDEHKHWHADHCVDHASEIWPLLYELYV